jgi:hypothetical protein
MSLSASVVIYAERSFEIFNVVDCRSRPQDAIDAALGVDMNIGVPGL